ncbi:hypothetical protein ECC02_002995 [Trypanosoma cruzi]|uniref:Exonuclease domain-containing protein n=1 Tax=Trypanosoma cruzi TaxID=5693 RepID=A0A7J6YAM9_TRYCR|nr:hypothetical protein ECC02_002995 [Trypanosoma cruzi]
MPTARSKRQRTPSATSSPLLTHALEARGHRIASTSASVMPHGEEELLLPPPTSKLCAHGSAHQGTDDSKSRDEKNIDVNNTSNAHFGVSSANSNGSMITAAVTEQFLAVEIYFQLVGQRNQGDFLFPRDVGDLLLWSVPAAVPLIEGPRVFFLKNKSRLRDVVMICVNGWTHDEMILAYASNPAEDDGIHEEEAKHSPRGQPLRHEAAEMKAHNGNSWAERIGRAMLAPVRAQQCWARKECGVQFAPMLLPGARSSLVREIFWRNDAPKAPRDGQRRGCPSLNKTNAEQKCEKSGNRGVAVVGKLPSATSEAAAAASSGVGNFFKRALVIHGKATTNDETSLSPAAAAASSVPSNVAEVRRPDDADPSLWDDRATLLRYALSIEKDRAVLGGLGYVLDLPSDCAEAVEWKTFDASQPSTGEGDGVQPVRVFAMDCEMVLVADNVSALARITLLDVRAGAVVLDTLVKPATKVVDYITRYSGVDEAMLEGVTTTLQDCQRELQRHIDTETFVVGHSLENDFRACKMLPNCYVLDTAHLFPHPAGLPYKNSLRFLAMHYLQKRIQQGSHDSAEDASTSAELAYLKLKHGPEFGIRKRVSILQLIENSAMAGGGNTGELGKRDKTPSEHPATPPTDSSSSSLCMELNLFDDACVLRDIIPSGADAKNGSLFHVVPVRHDRDAMRKAVRCLQQRRCEKQHTEDGVPCSYALTWVQLTETVEPRRQDVEEKEKEEEEEGRSWEQLQLERVDETNRRVMQIIRAAPHNSLIVVLAGGGSKSAEGTLSGNSRGVCFAFVKDDNSPGPPVAWLDAEPQVSVTAASPAGAAVGRGGTVETPPACQQQ